MQNDKVESVVQLFLKVMNRYSATEKKAADYGIGTPLYRAEIHTVDAIGKHAHINITDLSDHLGVSKSAVSQMIQKLIKKELVVKTILSPSDTEVALTLTEKGETVYSAHLAHHHKLYQYLAQSLSEISEDNMAIFKNIMNELDVFLQEEN